MKTKSEGSEIATLERPVCDHSPQVETLLREKLNVCGEMRRQCRLERRWIRKENMGSLIRGLDGKKAFLERLETIDGELERLRGGLEPFPGNNGNGVSEVEKKILNILSEIDYINKRNEEMLRHTKDELIKEVKNLDQSVAATRAYRRSFS